MDPAFANVQFQICRGYANEFSVCVASLLRDQHHGGGCLCLPFLSPLMCASNPFVFQIRCPIHFSSLAALPRSAERQIHAGSQPRAVRRHPLAEPPVVVSLLTLQPAADLSSARALPAASHADARPPIRPRRMRAPALLPKNLEKPSGSAVRGWPA